ncbi:MAG: DUF4197 domain-containing protein [Bacteroidetes bacterium]|nr:DUF4197 domain-containing protein [Bacteroidota bacterium]
MKQLLFGLAFMAGTVTIIQSCDGLLSNLPEGLTEEQIVNGLKEALKVGTDTAVTQLSKEDGYFGDELVKISLPSEAQVIIDNLSKIPLLGQAAVDETIKLINRSAEDAATEAAPIFVNAVQNMTVTDGVDILYGADSAATAYLRKNTYSELFSTFLPKVEGSLSKTLVGNVSAESSYKTLVDAYNTIATIPFSGLEKIENTTLSEYTTHKALKGLFIKVADEEKDIRQDVNARVNDTLKEVFGELDK